MAGYVGRTATERKEKSIRTTAAEMIARHPSYVSLQRSVAAVVRSKPAKLVDRWVVMMLGAVQPPGLWGEAEPFVAVGAELWSCGAREALLLSLSHGQGRITFPGNA